MVLELARTRLVPKPWGVGDVMPWHASDRTGENIGEVWFERPGPPAGRPALLLKLLFTGEPLSIQVHPDNDYARSRGEPNGKTEAWYVLQSTPGACVAVGLQHKLTALQFRQALDDGTIMELLAWRPVARGDVVSVPAGTVHAIGAGLVLAEIQQRSDTTFRIFDHGRQRELHKQSAIDVAVAGPAAVQAPAMPLSKERTLLVANPYFVLEQLDLAPNSEWVLDATPETWLLVLEGSAVAGSLDIAKGAALFAQAERIALQAGRMGMKALVACEGTDWTAPLLRPSHAQIQPVPNQPIGAPRQVP